ncbi:MAG: response regulator transcription factor [Solirubrobacteraceae bacterium]|nr:response regulator transcription factor [Solirubrobacteraceae bacterium]
MTAQPDPIKVAVADAHPVVGLGIEAIVNDDDRLELAASETAIDENTAPRLRRADVVLADTATLDQDPVDTVAALQSQPAEPKVLFFGDRLQPARVLRAVRAGAAGALGKTATAGQIADAIVGAARGAAVLTPALRTRFARAGRPGPNLSAREQRALELAADGHTAREIGARMHVAESTAKAHLSTAYRKLGARNRAGAIRAAAEHGLLDDPAPPPPRAR